MPSRSPPSIASSSSSHSYDQQLTGATRDPPLEPPKPLFFIPERRTSSEGDPFRDSSMPGTPKSTASNPFSPPSSVVSFSTDAPLPGSGSGQPILNRNPSSRVSMMSALRHASTEDSQDGPREVLRGSQIRGPYMAPPTMSRRTTLYDTDLVPRAAKRQRSTMLMGPIEKPWTKDKDVYVRISYYLTYAVAMIGVIGGALRCYFEWRDVPRLGNVCLVMQDDFDSLDTTNTWTQEVDMGGFGNGEFEMTTNSANNTFVRDGMLYMVPTLTSDIIGYDNVMNGYTYNVSGCTSANLTSCGAVSNQTAGTVINPVMSSRLTTVKSHSIKYGKVEIVAKLPTGDWLWPALWMLPVDNTYGPWPASGEIDIMEARGNGPSYGAQGLNYVRSSLNWGPFTFLNGVGKTFGWWTRRRSTFAQGFHTYTLEWSPKFIRIYVDTRLHYMLNLALNEPFFKRGDFPATVQNDSQYIVTPDPWVNGTANVAPFDQPFYLILNVAVGGTNGWFPDGVGSKPWLDGSLTAMRDFAAAQDVWSATWPQNIEDRAMIVDSVKMYELC